jgi:signal transduction histidine kinase
MTKGVEPHEPPDILVVDDTPTNLQVLSGMLKDRGYKVRPAPSGSVALAAAKQKIPDLVLLDINMPELNGYEVCTQLKRDERMRDIPVIFISALNETIDKVVAFGVGGVDYVTKPFQFEEVEARVAVHLKLRRLQLDLESRNQELQQSNRELRRLQELRDNLTHMIVHDLRSPLTGILAAMELIGFDTASLSPENQGALRMANKALDDVISMINSMLDVSKIEAGELKPNLTECDLVEVVKEAAARLELLRGDRTVELACDRPCPARLDRDLISRVIQNLVGNAFKFTNKSGTVRLRIEQLPKRVRISVTDDGPGIAPEHHARIFEKFGQAESIGPRAGTGLGLTFCRLAVQAHAGSIGVESEPGKGSVFWFELPLAA